MLAADEAASATLRSRKHREDKPFAVMVSTVDEARTLAEIDEVAEDLLRSHRRPIVLLPKLAGAPVAEAVAPGNRAGAARGPGRAGRLPGEHLRRARHSGVDLVRAVTEELLAGVDPAVIAARFHNGVAGVIVRACAMLGDQTGIGTVAQSGGVFQNLLLLHRTVDRLRANGFHVLTHTRVPTNDGGISLGQAAVAAARDRAVTIQGEGGNSPDLSAGSR